MTCCLLIIVKSAIFLRCYPNQFRWRIMALCEEMFLTYFSLVSVPGLNFGGQLFQNIHGTGPWRVLISSVEVQMGPFEGERSYNSILYETNFRR
jgi:hypothetical protein